MNIASLSNQLVAWFKNQGAELLHAGKAEPRTGQFNSGEQYLGKVEQTLPNGRSLVQVGQTRLDMALPREVRPGDSVRLVYMTSGPRPTFQLVQTPVAAVQSVRLSDSAQQVNALVRFAQAGATPGVAASPAPGANVAQAGSATPAQAGQAGQAAQAAAAQGGMAAARPIIANVALLNAAAASPPLTSAMTGGAANPTMALVGQAVDAARPGLATHASLLTQGIITEQNASGTVLPMRLRQVLSESGLFYESHLGRWTQGRMTLEAIQREPQARLIENPGRILNQPGLDGMPEEAARIAGRQLQMLEGASFYWQGYAWPNQWLDWQVHEDATGGYEDPEAARWQTRLHLQLPRLGDVAAEIGISARGLKIKLMTGREDTLAEAKAALPQLIERLRNADLKLTGIEIGLADGDPGPST